MEGRKTVNQKHLARRQAYIQRSLNFFRIRKGEAISQWTTIDKVCVLDAKESGIYFAFLAPLSYLIDGLDPEIVYHAKATKTKVVKAEEEIEE
jgi:hypothetical protein